MPIKMKQFFIVVYIIDAEPKGLKSKVMLETGEMGADIIINQLV